MTLPLHSGFRRAVEALRRPFRRLPLAGAACLAALARSKFKSTPAFGQKVKGHHLLQDHHSEVWFRNLKLRPLAEP